MSWNYDPYDSNYPILDKLDNHAENDDLHSSTGIFSFFNFVIVPKSDINS